MTELHIDTEKDVAISFHVSGSEAELVDELARSLGGALAMGRIAAAAQGDDELARFLEFASVDNRRDGGFTLEIAVPLRYLREKLGSCASAEPEP